MATQKGHELKEIDKFMKEADLWDRATLVSSSDSSSKIILQKTGKNTVHLCLDTYHNGIRPLILNKGLVDVLVENQALILQVIQYVDELNDTNTKTLRLLLSKPTKDESDESDEQAAETPSEDEESNGKGKATGSRECDKCGGE